MAQDKPKNSDFDAAVSPITANFAPECGALPSVPRRKQQQMTSRNDNKEQFHRMFLRHYPRLVRLATQFTGDGDEARDIVADVMETAWRRHAGMEEGCLGAWLYRCVRNACLNRLRHIKVENCHMADLIEATKAATDGDYLRRERLLTYVEAVAGSLKEPTRSIIRMCYYEHMTHAQAAERLGISPETVKKHIRKAFDAIRSSIKINEEL